MVDKMSGNLPHVQLANGHFMSHSTPSNEFSLWHQPKVKVLFLSNMLPSQIPVHTNAHTFCKKNNGINNTINNNSAVIVIVLLSLSCTEICLIFTISLKKPLLSTVFSRMHLSTTIFKAWSFVCKNLEKTQNPQQNPITLPLWLGTQQAKQACERRLLLSANPVSFSVIPQTHPEPLLQHGHVTYLQLHFKISLSATKLNVLSKGQTLFLK